MKNKSILLSKKLAVGYGGKSVAANLNLHIEQGEMVCLIGPNGSGKSTLLRTLAGIQLPVKGDIFIDGKPLKSQEPGKLARLIAIVLTNKMGAMNFTVYDMVALGRTPYTNWLGILSGKDRKIIQWAMKLVEIESLANRQVHELSDGEKQRVMVAKALVQDTPIIILDEPTAHLDVMNRIALLSLLKKLSRETGKVILLSTHELDMAIQVADLIWLMDKNGEFNIGSPEDLVLRGAMNRVFKGDFVGFDAEVGNFRMQYDLNKKITVSGNGMVGNWTCRALKKEGYAVSISEDLPLKVAIKEGAKNQWQLTNQKGEKEEAYSIQELIKILRNNG